MFNIYKFSSASPIDYAAEELRKYLRMMMPECGAIDVKYDPEAKDGFRLGLMQDLGLDVSDAEDTELDDIIYIDTDDEGGIIAGDNPRSVLLAVYEYLRKNGCRWLMPGVDGEFIPIRDIVPVRYRHKPSCRYRGQCNEGGEYQPNMIDVIDFTPKIGMNVFMMEHFIPLYYNNYYRHHYNTENFAEEPVSERQILQWKRECEAEIQKRGLQFHDIGHGFMSEPFGLKLESGKEIDYNERVAPEMKKYLTLLDGERKLYRKDHPYYANFCMSNKEARGIVCDFIVRHARKNPCDYLHVWLADGANNHCECEECRKKTASDWYAILLNEMDEALTAAGLSTKIVFISYVDTIWAPTEEIIKNRDRFTMLFAPIHRSYAYSLPEKSEETTHPYVRNKNVYPGDLAVSFDYYHLWERAWGGPSVAYEYHFWWAQVYDISGLEIARRAHDDVKLYKSHGINGIIEDCSQRSFFPNGFAFYAYARTLFDTALTYDGIMEDYFSHAYGEDWRDFRDYLKELSEALPFSVLSKDEAAKRPMKYYAPELAERIRRIREITKKGRELIKAHYNSEVRVRTVSVRLLEHHAAFCDLLSDLMVEKVLGDDEAADRCYETLRIEFGKHEVEILPYYDQFNHFGAIRGINRLKKPEGV